MGLVVMASAGTAQERAVQMGTKTSYAGYAVATELVMPIDDQAKAGKTFEKAFDDLASMAEAEGFTLLGQAQIVMQSLTPPADGRMPLQLQLVIIEQPTEEDLKAEPGFKIVKLQGQKVAYTYHKGALDQIQMAMFGLVTWVTGNQIQIVGAPWIIIHFTPEGDEPQVAEIQMPVK